MEEAPKKLEINPKNLNFKDFLENIRDNSGLSTEDFLKYKITIPINDLETFKKLKNIKNLSLELEKRTEEELKDDTYLKELNKIDLNLITINSELNEFYAKTNIIQYYKNYSNNPIELILKFPYSSDVQFSKFTLEMQNKKIISKVLNKEKAEEKYNDAIAKGNTGVISSIKDKYINVTIGNIPPGELIKLTTEFIQFLISEDMSYCYNTIKNFPKIDNKAKEKRFFKIKAKINIKTKSRITRLITKGFRQDLTKKFNEDYTSCELYYYTANFTKKEKKENQFKILFRTQSMNDLNLITQYDPKKDETSCILNMFYTKKSINIPIKDIPDLNNKENYFQLYQQNIINSNPSLFIFLLDKSGSMWGERIELAKEALIFFLRSLPKNSYYHLIAFGSNFEYIGSKEPCEYTTENVEKTISDLKAIEPNGSTNLLKPLDTLFKSKKYNKINLARNMFILTDGEVDNEKATLRILLYNSINYRIHTFGIGNEYNKEFIKQAGENGSYNFVSEISNLKSKVIETLNSALRSYIYDPKISVENNNLEHTFFPKKKIYYQDEVLNYYFIIKNKIEDKIKINFEYVDKTDIIKKEIIFDDKNIVKETDGDIISKIIIGNILNNENNNSIEINKEIELAKKYQVLSKSTSLFAEVENENSNATLSQLEVVEQNENNFPKKKQKEQLNKKCSDSEDEEDKSSDSDNIKDGIKKRRGKIKKRKVSSDSSEGEKHKKKCKKDISEDSEDYNDEIKIKMEEEQRVKKECEEKCGNNDRKLEEELKRKYEEEKCIREKMKPKKDKCKEKRKEKKCERADSNIDEESGSKSISKLFSDSEEEEKKEKEIKKIKILSKKEKSEEPKQEEKKVEDLSFKNIILTQNIIEGNWTLNPQTENLIKNNRDIYDKIKTYIEKYYNYEDKNDVIITILVLYLIKNDKNIDMKEYILMFNKGVEYLESRGFQEINYKNVEEYLSK